MSYATSEGFYAQTDGERLRIVIDPRNAVEVQDGAVVIQLDIGRTETLRKLLNYTPVKKENPWISALPVDAKSSPDSVSSPTGSSRVDEKAPAWSRISTILSFSTQTATWLTALGTMMRAW